MNLGRLISRQFKPPTQEQRVRWQQRKIAGGKNKFVFRIGVLGWGGFMFISMTADSLMRKPAFPHSPIYYILDIAVGLLVWPTAGYFFGLAMWGFFESYFSDENSGHSDKQ